MNYCIIKEWLTMLINKKGGVGPFINNGIKAESKISRDTRKFFTNTVDAHRLVKRKKTDQILSLNITKYLKFPWQQRFFFSF
jgi:hypothetical protein